MTKSASTYGELNEYTVRCSRLSPRHLLAYLGESEQAAEAIDRWMYFRRGDCSFPSTRPISLEIIRRKHGRQGAGFFRPLLIAPAAIGKVATSRRLIAQNA